MKNLNDIDITSLIFSLKRKNESQLKSMQYSVLNSRPLFDVEVSLFCNYNCVMCPRDKIKRKKGLMLPETFEKLVDWFPSNANVMFSGMGEPLLNPNLTSFVKILKDNSFHPIGITTNASLLNHKVLEKLLSSGISFIQISMMGNRKSTYQSIMKGGNYQLIRENLKNLFKNKNREEVSIQLVILKYENNEEEINELTKFAKNHDIEIIIRKVHSRGGNLYRKELEMSFFKVCGTFPKVTFITWNGELLACSHDLAGNTCIGDIYSITFDELQEIKKKIIKTKKWFEICSYCDDPYRYLHLINPMMIDPGVGY